MLASQTARRPRTSRPRSARSKSTDQAVEAIVGILRRDGLHQPLHLDHRGVGGGAERLHAGDRPQRARGGDRRAKELAGNMATVTEAIDETNRSATHVLEASSVLTTIRHAAAGGRPVPRAGRGGLALHTATLSVCARSRAIRLAIAATGKRRERDTRVRASPAGMRCPAGAADPVAASDLAAIRARQRGRARSRRADRRSTGMSAAIVAAAARRSSMYAVRNARKIIARPHARWARGRRAHARARRNRRIARAPEHRHIASRAGRTICTESSPPPLRSSARSARRKRIASTRTIGSSCGLKSSLRRNASTATV